MAQIRIHFSGVQTANNGLKSTLGRLESVETALRRLQKELDPEIQSRYKVEAQLKSCKKEVSSLRAKAKRLYDATDSGARKYRTAESRLCRSAPNNDVVTRGK